jgi:HicA-like toxin of HicAB toxin-antitoxin system
MTSKHRKTLKAIFQDPVKSNIIWEDIEALFVALGAERFEGSGSRIRFLLNGIKATFHRPHPQKETDKGAVKSVRRFLEEGGIRP